MASLLLVFVHGYSVTNIDTYAGLPLRLKNEALSRGIDARVENIFLGRYISFNDEVRLNDLAGALDTAVRQQIPDILSGQRFVCITHSTGGPLVRTWWDHFYKDKNRICPMSHLIMLAPANYGSALAQLGKSRLSRIKSWFDGVEPGQKILDWLEHGSRDAFELNVNWIKSDGKHISENGIFPFVITGQDIDRKLYDHINSYTGEIGSDGVVRVASANLNSAYVKLHQSEYSKNDKTGTLHIEEIFEAPHTPFCIVKGKSHSGETMGIMKSVRPGADDLNSEETITAIFSCIGVAKKSDYEALNDQFFKQTALVQTASKIEVEKKFAFSKTYIHDRHAMVIFRIFDTDYQPIKNFDLILTAGENSDPDALPPGFFTDRQCNRLEPNTLTYFFNYDILTGAEAVLSADGEVIRKALPGTDTFGIIVRPRPDEGFIRYLPCELKASKEFLTKALRANGTTLVDICLNRIVSEQVFRFEKIEDNEMPDKNFKKVKA